MQDLFQGVWTWTYEQDLTSVKKDDVDSDDKEKQNEDSWYDDEKGRTNEERKKWYQELASEWDCPGCIGGHNWHNGEYIHCKDCRETSENYTAWRIALHVDKILCLGNIKTN